MVNKYADLFDQSELDEKISPDVIKEEPKQPQIAELPTQQPQQISQANDYSDLFDPTELDTSQSAALSQSAAPQGEQSTTSERFAQGFNESTSGQVAKLAFDVKKKPEELKGDPGFWEGLVQTSGELTGDLPYIAAGTTLGASIGLAVGSRAGPWGAGVGSLVGGAAGGFGLNGFLKESLKQYHDFQDKGGDLTFGEFLNRADKVANKTLSEGAMGVMLGTVKKAIPLLKTIPGIDKLFSTKYIGKPLQTGAELGAEIATATTVPAAVQGRLPTAQEIGQASVLFAGPRIATAIPNAIAKTIDYVPQQISHVVNKARYGSINTAIAEQLDKANLAYPSLYELKGQTEKLQENSLSLNRNIAEFDKSYIDEFIGRINNISPTDFPNAHAAGTAMKNMLMGQTPETRPEPQVVSVIEQAGIAPKGQVPSNANIKGRVGEAPTTAEAIKTLELTEPKVAKEQVATLPPEPLEIPKPVKPVRPMTAESNPLHQGVETISKERFKNNVDAGRQIHDEYHRIRNDQYQPLQRRYENIEEASSGVQIMDENLAQQTRDFIEEYDQSAVPNSPEAVVIQKAKELMSLLGEIGENGEISGTKEFTLRKLIKTNQSLKKVPNWNLPGDFRKVLGELIDRVDESIDTNLRRNLGEDIANEFTQLNGDYRLFKNRFDNSATRVFNDPTFKDEAIYKKFSNIDNFNQLTEALSLDPQGQNVLNKQRRDVWEQRLGENALNAKTNEEFVNSTSKVSEREFSNLMEFLSPQQRVTMNERVQDVNRLRSAQDQVESDYLIAQENYNEAVAMQKREQKNVSRNEKLSREQEKINRERQTEIERLQKEKERQKSAYDKMRESLKNDRAKDLRQKVTDEQDLLVSILEQDPAKIAKNVDTIEGVKRFKKMSENVKGGEDLFKAVARYKTDQMFDFIRTSFNESKRVPYAKIKNLLTNKDQRGLLEAMNGPEFVKSLDELVNISDQLSKNFKEMQIKFIRDPETYNSFVTTMSVLGIMTGDYGLPVIAQTVRSGKKWGSQKVAHWWDEKSNTQENIKKTLDAARAVRSGNADQIRKTSEKL